VTTSPWESINLGRIHPWRPLIRGGHLDPEQSRYQPGGGGSFVVASNLRPQDALPSLAAATWKSRS